MRKVSLALALLCVSTSVSFAKGSEGSTPSSYDAVEKTLPICRDGSKTPFRSNNEEVLKWKTSTRNQWQGRGYVIGKLVAVLQQRPSHTHLEIDISPNGSSDKADHVEIIYNVEFGAVQNPQPGQLVAACGDFINSFDRAGKYPASPVGAIVHWVHASNTPNKHSHGFLSVNGKLYGFEGDGAGQKPEMGNDSTQYGNGDAAPEGDDRNEDRGYQNGNNDRNHDKKRRDQNKKDRRDNRMIEQRAMDYSAGDDLPWDSIRK
ncbi:MAG: hypothetical protein EOP11_17805, partial [Proteobacteria bacterium]